MRKPSKASIKSTSISLEEALGQKTEADIKTIDPTDLSQSPLNSQPVVEKDYTSRQASTEQITAPQEQSSVVQSQPVIDQPVTLAPEASSVPLEEEGYSMEVPNEYVHLPDVPEQEISNPLPSSNPSSINQAETPKQEGSETIDKVMAEGSESLAETVLTVYETLIPGVIDQFTSIKTRPFKDHVAKGDISPLVIDDIKARNKENLGLLKNRAKEDTKMMEKPLKKLLVKSGIQVPPQWELAIVFAIIIMMNFFLIKDIKRDNEALQSKILNTLREKKETERKSTLATVVEEKKDDSSK